MQSEEALQKERDFILAVLDTVSALIVVLDSQGCIVRFNRACEQTTGYSFDEVRGRYVWDLFLIPEEVEPVKAVFKELRSGQFPNGHKNHWVTRDGSRRLIAWSNTTLFDDEGAVEYVIGTGVDVTERAWAEKALRESERKFRSIVEQLSDGIALVDEQGTIVEWNRCQEQISGLERAEALGRPLWEVQHQLLPEEQRTPEMYQQLKAGILEFLKTGQAARPDQWLEQKIQRADLYGTQRFIQMSVFPIKTARGFMAGSVTHDITEQIKVKQEIRQRNQELVVLNEIGRAITSTLDLGETLTLVTDHTTRLLGVEAASLLLRDEAHDDLWFAAGSGVDADLVLGKRLAMDQGIAGWVVRHGEPALVPDVSQDPRWFSGFTQESSFTVRSILCVPLQSKGQVIGALEVLNKKSGPFDREDLRLLTALAAPAAVAIENARLFEQVRAGHERQQALSRRLVEMQEADRRRISRELHDETGQALSSLLLGLSLLEREADRPDAVLARAAGLEGMVEEMLENLHRLAMNLRPATLDHLGLVAALEQYVETFSQQHSITVQFETVGIKVSGQRLPPTVETALYRIVQEALTNVIRHAQATQVDVLLERRGDQLVVIVEDDGVGFDPEEAVQGGRLGLFGIRERAEMLGGSLVMESTIGAGTTVFVEIPYAHSDSRRR